MNATPGAKIGDLDNKRRGDDLMVFAADFDLGRRG